MLGGMANSLQIKIHLIVTGVMGILAPNHQGYSCSNLPQDFDNAEDEIPMVSPQGEISSKDSSNQDLTQ